jgi:hypothetical protein
VATGTFDRGSVDLRPWHSSDPDDGALYVQVAPRSWGPSVNPRWDFYPGFIVHNTHSAPVSWSDSTTVINLSDPSRMRSLPPATACGVTALQAIYATRLPDSVWGPQYSPGSPVNVLSGRLPQAVRQAQLDVDDQWSMPFFMSDARSAFYVTASVSYRWFNVFEGYGLAAPGQILGNGLIISLPPVVVDAPPRQPGAPVEITGRLGDPATAQSALAEAAGMRAVLGSVGTVDFGGVAIGATGAVNHSAPQINEEENP